MKQSKREARYKANERLLALFCPPVNENIGKANCRTVNTVNANLYEVKGYVTPTQKY
jgi:hypothetical protein